MDIMRPKLQRIGNMCFRRLDLPNDGIIDVLKDLDLEKTYEEWSEEEEKVEFKEWTTIETKSKLLSIDSLEEWDDIQDISGGKGKRFRAEVDIVNDFHRFIIGSKGQQKEEIELQSYCKIKVPQREDKSSPVVITGDNVENIRYAITKIKDIAKRNRYKCEFTHFVSIPFNESSIWDRFVTFKSKILNESQLNKGIDKSLFQTPNNLHITIAPLLLMDQKEKDLSSKILEECHQDFIKPLLDGQTLKIRLEGIDYMNDDPTQVNVIFAKVYDMSDKKCLQSIGDYIWQKYEESGLLKDNRFNQLSRVDGEPIVKLHVTLMNTAFLNKGRDDNQRERNRKEIHFDGSHILQKFKNYYFGQIDVHSIEISIRHSFSGTDGYYSHSSKIDL